MLEIEKRLQEDYDRWVKKIADDPFVGPKTIGAIEVLQAHYLILDHFWEIGGEGYGGVGPRNLDLLFSTLGRQMSSYGSVVKWSNEIEICATLFYGLIKNHVFYDANKRTAFLTLLLHLWKNNLVPDASHDKFEALALGIASNSLDDYHDYKKFKNEDDPEIKLIASFLKRHTRRRDPKLYLITYRELNRILQNNGFWLTNPAKNKIEVWQRKNELRLTLRGRKPYTTEKRIGVIDYPGETRQISRNDLREVRQLTGLTDENGYDGAVFFGNATPLAAYIDQYHGLLKKLSKK